MDELVVPNLRRVPKPGPRRKPLRTGGTMKRAFTSIAIAIAVVGFAGITGCGDDAGDNDAADTTAMHDSSTIDADSGVGGASEVSADKRQFNFDGTATKVEGDMITIDHEEIGDYKPAGSNTFKLADKEMAQFIEQGEKMQYTIEIVGDQPLITVVETIEDDGDDDLDTIGSNSGVDTVK